MTTSSKLTIAARFVTGGLFLFSGLNGLLHFVPMPPLPAAAGEFVGALVATGYLLPILKTTEIVAALMLLTGRFVPLALTMLAPVLVNVVAFHAVLAPQGIAVPLVLLVGELYLAWVHRDAFAPLLRAKSTSAIDEVPAHAKLASAS
jgi:uncharacterized membrane protein YphA (DoxX/SURF4 family)